MYKAQRPPPPSSLGCTRATTGGTGAPRLPHTSLGRAPCFPHRSLGEDVRSGGRRGARHSCYGTTLTSSGEGLDGPEGLSVSTLKLAWSEVAGKFGPLFLFILGNKWSTSLSKASGVRPPACKQALRPGRWSEEAPSLMTSTDAIRPTFQGLGGLLATTPPGLISPPALSLAPPASPWARGDWRSCNPAVPWAFVSVEGHHLQARHSLHFCE